MQEMKIDLAVDEFIQVDKHRLVIRGGDAEVSDLTRLFVFKLCHAVNMQLKTSNSVCEAMYNADQRSYEVHLVGIKREFLESAKMRISQFWKSSDFKKEADSMILFIHLVKEIPGQGMRGEAVQRASNIHSYFRGEFLETMKEVFNYVE